MNSILFHLSAESQKYTYYFCTGHNLRHLLRNKQFDIHIRIISGLPAGQFLEVHLGHVSVRFEEPSCSAFWVCTREICKEIYNAITSREA
jgi:hypothetical protein